MPLWLSGFGLDSSTIRMNPSPACKSNMRITPCIYGIYAFGIFIPVAKLMALGMVGIVLGTIKPKGKNGAIFGVGILRLLRRYGLKDSRRASMADGERGTARVLQTAKCG